MHPLRPLEQMADRAETIGGDQLSVRLPVTGAGSELDRLGATINQMVDRLEDHIARERQFTADASHEMRTPLAIMRAELELAEAATDEPTRKRLISAREEIDRLAALVDDLVVLARADADELDTLFDRFGRTDTARTSAGTGLGLAIVAAVAQAHHGTASAHDRPTGGLQIDITLPRHPPH